MILFVDILNFVLWLGHRSWIILEWNYINFYILELIIIVVDIHLFEIIINEFVI